MLTLKFKYHKQYSGVNIHLFRFFLLTPIGLSDADDQDTFDDCLIRQAK